MKSISIAILCTLPPLFFFAQSHDHVWLFGYGQQEVIPFSDTRMDFNGCSVDISDDPRDPVFFQSAIAVSDEEGSLLFYSNGKRVFSHNGVLMENGDSLNAGDYWETTGSSYVSKAQNIIGLPFSVGSDEYHLLHIGGRIFPDVSDYYGFSFFYSTVDMGENGGEGRVTEKNTPIVQDTLWSDKVTAVKHANGRDWWAVVNEYNTNNYYKILATPEGASLAGSQEVGTPVNNGLGQAVFSPDGSKYAVYNTVSNIEGQSLHVYDFDRCSGELSNEIYIHTMDTVGASGVAISPNSRFVYVSALTKLWQYDLWAADVPASVVLVGEYDGFMSPFHTAFFQAQLAPNGKIYMAAPNGVNVLHTIEKPNEKGLACDFRQHNVDLLSHNGTTMLNFPNYRLGPLDGSPCDSLGLDNFPVAKFYYEQDSSDYLHVKFTDVSHHEPAERLWDFGDNSTSQEIGPEHIFQDYGEYEVCLTVWNALGTNTLCKNLKISQAPNSTISRPELNLSIFPNPATEKVYVEINDGYVFKNSSISLYDAIGQLRLKERLHPGPNQLILTDLNPGLYFLQIENEKGEVLQTEKVVVQR